MTYDRPLTVGTTYDGRASDGTPELWTVMDRKPHGGTPGSYGQVMEYKFRRPDGTFFYGTFVEEDTDPTFKVFKFMSKKDKEEEDAASSP